MAPLPVWAAEAPVPVDSTPMRGRGSRAAHAMHGVVAARVVDLASHRAGQRTRRDSSRGAGREGSRRGPRRGRRGRRSGRPRSPLAPRPPSGVIAAVRALEPPARASPPPDARGRASPTARRPCCAARGRPRPSALAREARLASRTRSMVLWISRGRGRSGGRRRLGSGRGGPARDRVLGRLGAGRRRRPAAVQPTDPRTTGSQVVAVEVPDVQRAPARQERDRAPSAPRPVRTRSRGPTPSRDPAGASSIRDGRAPSPRARRRPRTGLPGGAPTALRDTVASPHGRCRGAATPTRRHPTRSTIPSSPERAAKSRTTGGKPSQIGESLLPPAAACVGICAYRGSRSTLGSRGRPRSPVSLRAPLGPNTKRWPAFTVRLARLAGRAIEEDLGRSAPRVDTGRSVLLQSDHDQGAVAELDRGGGGQDLEHLALLVVAVADLDSSLRQQEVRDPGVAAEGGGEDRLDAQPGRPVQSNDGARVELGLAPSAVAGHDGVSREQGGIGDGAVRRSSRPS